MKGIRFYLEYPNSTEKDKATRKAIGNHEGNVAAVFYENWRVVDGEGYYDAISAAYFRPNSPVCSGSVSDGWLKKRGKRISETQAREIHPALFDYLDSSPG